MSFARVRINLDAVASNFRLFRSSVSGETGAVVKANGYGLGAERVAERLVTEGCRSFFVATLDEALALTISADANVYVFEPPLDRSGFRETQNKGYIPVVNDPNQLEFASELQSDRVALHVDTGMERLGVPYRSLDVARIKQLKPMLVMTHLACADDPEHPFNETQVERFRRVIEELGEVRTSIGNSAGSLLGERFQGDLVRPGIGLYGANPFASRKNPTEIVATCEAQVVAIRDVKAGEGIGYGLTHICERPTRIAVVGIGYADGVPRVLSNRGNFAFGELLLPILGHVSMDMTQVDATACPELNVGDWVEFFGKTIDCDVVAKLANSLGYEFLTGLGKRVQRAYV